MNLTVGTRPDSSNSPKLVEVSETPVKTALPRDSDFATMLDTNLENSKQNLIGNDVRGTGRSSPNLLFSKPIDGRTSSTLATARVFDAQSPDKLHLTSLKLSGTNLSGREGGRLYAVNEYKTEVNEHVFAKAGCDESIQNLERSSSPEMDKMQLSLNSKTDTDSGEVDMFCVKTQNSASDQNRVASTQNADDLLVFSSHKSTAQGLSQNTSSNRDLLSFQTEPRSQMLPGGLVLPSSNSYSGPRRPFPKDMKSEADGFDFIRKSKVDAFSFINDEIQANKNKPK